METMADHPSEPDSGVAAVTEWLGSEKRVESIGRGIRAAIDWVIDGARTRRYSLGQVEQSEKLYLGNRIEHEVLHELGLVKNPQGIDTAIEGHEVDIKFSLSTNWMIPPEGVGHICMLLSADDDSSVFSVGVFRAAAELLNASNRDEKRSIKRSAARNIVHWLAKDAPLSENFLLHLDPDVRTAILNEKSGQARVTQAFRLVQEKPISIVALDTLAVQRDPSKRVRDARKALEKEGILVLCGRWESDQKTLKRLGLPPLGREEWMSTRRS
ncbi:MAG: NaeI family type II restriction endonuclease [Planctomycetota bacterium]|nr:NaeI family type II restriction endonuclease [Planctomycetota bacterium]